MISHLEAIIDISLLLSARDKKLLKQVFLSPIKRYQIYFCNCVIRNLHAGRVILQVLRVLGIAVDTLSTLGSLFSSIPPYRVVGDSGKWGDWQVTSPIIAALPLARRRSINCHRHGREREFIPIPPLPSISKNSLIPSIGLIGTPSSFIFAVSLLLNLEAARWGRSMLFSDEQKLLFEGGKKGGMLRTPNWILWAVN